MKTAKRIIFSCVLVILATAFIFSNSLKNGEQSNKDSGVIEEVVEPIIIGITHDPNTDVNFIVRKGAHLTEFCVLGITVMCTVLAVYTRFGKKIMGYGFFYVLAVAVTDEFIQSFSDRTSSVRDVLIDFTGSMIGFLLVFAVVSIIMLYKKKHLAQKKDT